MIVVPGVHHDLESFFWVVVYAIWKNKIQTLSTTAERKNLTKKKRQSLVARRDAFKTEFATYFSGTTFKSIVKERLSMLDREGLEPELKGPLGKLVKKFQRMVQSQNLPDLTKNNDDDDDVDDDDDDDDEHENEDGDGDDRNDDGNGDGDETGSGDDNGEVAGQDNGRPTLTHLDVLAIFNQAAEKLKQKGDKKAQ